MASQRPVSGRSRSRAGAGGCARAQGPPSSGPDRPSVRDTLRIDDRISDRRHRSPHGLRRCRCVVGSPIRRGVGTAGPSFTPAPRFIADSSGPGRSSRPARSGTGPSTRRHRARESTGRCVADSRLHRHSRDGCPRSPEPAARPRPNRRGSRGGRSRSEAARAAPPYNPAPSTAACELFCLP